MQVKIIGGHGGVTKYTSATSYLVDDSLLIDAGSVASLEIEDQLKIDHILISHAHLDHTKDLAFICDNCFGLKDKPFQVHCHQSVGKAIKKHLFNDIIWPDFSVLPNKQKPTIVFNQVFAEKKFMAGDYSIFPVHVEHPVEDPRQALGFIVEKGDVAILFTQDTKGTEKIWEEGKKFKNLKAIFTEVSFPNKLQKVADVSDHHTPASIKKEMVKMPPNVPVFLGHLKPNYQEELIKEIKALKEDRLRILAEDGVTFHFS